MAPTNDSILASWLSLSSQVVISPADLRCHQVMLRTHLPWPNSAVSQAVTGAIPGLRTHSIASYVGALAFTEQRAGNPPMVPAGSSLGRAAAAVTAEISPTVCTDSMSADADPKFSGQLALQLQGHYR